VLEQMIETYEQILEGKDQTEALNQLLMKGVDLANDQLTEEENNVTDNGKSN
jgi:hypothetical protein